MGFACASDSLKVVQCALHPSVVKTLRPQSVKKNIFTAGAWICGLRNMRESVVSSVHSTTDMVKIVHAGRKKNTGIHRRTAARSG